MRVALCTAVLAALAGCSQKTPNRKGGGVSGVVWASGPVTGATVTAIRLNMAGQESTALAASAPTDERGRFTLPLAYHGGRILLRATGGSYVEPASGQPIELGSDDVIDLPLVDFVAFTEQAGLALTPVTTMAFQHARARGYDKNAMSSLDVFGLHFGARTSPATTEPVSFEVPVPSLEEQPATYGLLLSAMSELSLSMGREAGMPDHKSFSTLSLLRAGAQDVGHTGGVFDGRNEVGPIPAPSTCPMCTLSVETFRYRLATAAERFIVSPRNKSGLKLAHAQPFLEAVRMREHMDLFPDAPDGGIPEAGPLQMRCDVSSPCSDRLKHPICGPDGTCVPCTSHTQCRGPASSLGICADGGCPSYENAIIVENDPRICQADGPGTELEPKCQVASAYAAMAATDPRRIIVIRGPVGPFVHSRPDLVRVLGERGASIDLSSELPDANGIEVLAGALEVTNLEIFGGRGPYGAGVRVADRASATLERVIAGPNRGMGISAAPDAVLTIRRCAFRGNRGGGVAASRKARIENTFVTGNGESGDSGSTVGGVALLEASTFVFNTVADNRAKAASIPGVTCLGSEIRASIVHGNRTEHAASSDLAADCKAFDSIVPAAAASGPNNNIAALPQFLSPAAGDYRLRSSSPCKDRVIAGWAGYPGVDFEGDSRPQLGGLDCGADEIRP